MKIKVIILRRIPEDMGELEPLLIKLRSVCGGQPGYLGGETLINCEDATECLVVSGWEDLASWNAWLASDKRAEVQSQIDRLLGEPSQYQVYYCA